MIHSFKLCKTYTIYNEDMHNYSAGSTKFDTRKQLQSLNGCQAGWGNSAGVMTFYGKQGKQKLLIDIKNKFVKSEMKLLMNEAMIMIKQICNMVNIKFHQVFHVEFIDK